MTPDVFRGTGTVGEDLARVDWSATALGDPTRWPRSLRTIVRALLASRFSMWMAWGSELAFFCNDAYRRDTLGSKYPWALGRPASEVWAEIWPDIGPRIDRVLKEGISTWDQALLLFLERSGYREESYHTFSYSPLTDDDGAIVGMLCVVTEDTERVIGERQLATLRDLGTDPTAVRTEAETVAAACRQLESATASLPFTLVYRYDAEGRAVIAGTAAVPEGHPAAPAVIEPDDPGAAWPAAELRSGVPMVVDGLADRFPDLPRGSWAEPPSAALVVPLPQQGQTLPLGFLVAGLNRYRPLDEGYRGFIELVAGQIAARIATARAYESEWLRAERLAELDQAKTTFFTNISHEFRTPLTLLLGPTEDALADSSIPLPAEHRARFELVQRNGERLLRLVNSLLDFSRSEAGRLNARYEEVDLAKYTAELASSFATATARVGLALNIDCPPLPDRYWVDQEMWAKVVLNLLSNALKFTFDGSISVSVGPDPEGDGALLCVADTGIGIAPEDKAQLFERFSRISGARSRSFEGSGIGLALVAELVDLHGGTVGVESEPGKGSTFIVRLPRGRTISRTRRWPRAGRTRRVRSSGRRRGSWPKRSAGRRASRRRRPSRVPALVRRRVHPWSSSPTTTPTCGTTSRACCNATTACRPRTTGWRPSRRSAANRRTCCSPT
ncbi:MAG TPA: GAF domain-containing sensor histidine kinase [Frankiaceae bacterium]|nr:GAF domain-containing sensor histidine kinase [Frankiaceae bacterium]